MTFMTNAERRERKVMLAINRMLDAQRSFAVYGASEIEWPARWVSEAAKLLAEAAELERG
jgi:hypothetical protein